MILKKKVTKIDKKCLFEKYQKSSEFWDVEIESVNQHGLSGDTMLHVAVWQEDIEDIKKLILLGADIDSIGDLGNTPLQQAVLFEKAESIKILLSHGANTAIKNEFGEKAGDIATRNGMKSIITTNEKIQKSHI